MSTTTALILVAAIVVVAVAAWMFFKRQRSAKLRSKFGPEYEHAVRQYGGPSKAEDALTARQKRMEKIHIHPISNTEHDRFADLWHGVQSRFVDDPSGSIREADRLVADVMVARGYPMTDFEHRAEDISVDHPRVVKNFRTAHDIALRDERGEANTEDLRHALVCYRELFEELLEAPVASRR
jgi:hypothetical protein